MASDFAVVHFSAFLTHKKIGPHSEGSATLHGGAGRAVLL